MDNHPASSDTQGRILAICACALRPPAEPGIRPRSTGVKRGRREIKHRRAVSAEEKRLMFYVSVFWAGRAEQSHFLLTPNAVTTR